MRRKTIPATKVQGRLGAVSFSLKSTLLRIRKVAFPDKTIYRFSKTTKLSASPVLAESKTQLWTNDSDDNELVSGKVQNLRIAIRSLSGIEARPHQVFSFWKHIGRASRRKGYIKGRELREGCLIPSVGGGLCQLSNALYDAALQAGFEIIERHRHTRIIPGSLAELDRDATVFWNYVDLRFRSTGPFRIEVELTNDQLIVRFRGTDSPSQVLRVTGQVNSREIQKSECVGCGMDSCFRKSYSKTPHQLGQTVFIVDEFWPEFDHYIQSIRTGDDSLLIPVAGPRFLKRNYGWTTLGFSRVTSARSLALRRAVQSRRFGNQPPLLRRMLLDQNDRIAQNFARLLKPTDTHIVVGQTLLPYLWRDGHLGGRTFDVLMTQLPLRLLQQRLDGAFYAHPDSSTLADFRVNDSLPELELAALNRAQRLITPHSEIASLFPHKAQLLDWMLPDVTSTSYGPTSDRLFFPASTLGRKGAYELREALQGLNVELVLGGQIHEHKNFWQGFRVSMATSADPKNIAAVVLPSLVENRPGRLLAAVASGIPTIASEACGVSKLSGVTSVPTGDVNSLRAALHKILNPTST